MVADCLICLHREFYLFSLFYSCIICAYDIMNQNVQYQVSLTFWEVEKWVTRNTALWGDHGLPSYLVLLLVIMTCPPSGSWHKLMQYFNSVNVSLCLIATCLSESREHEHVIKLLLDLLFPTFQSAPYDGTHWEGVIWLGALWQDGVAAVGTLLNRVKNL